MQDLWGCVGFLYGEGETMLSQDLVVAPTQSRPPALIEGSGRTARDRIEHFLRAAIDNDNTRRAYGRALGSFFAFLEEGGRARIQDIGPLDVRDYLEAAKASLTLYSLPVYPDATESVPQPDSCTATEVIR